MVSGTGPIEDTDTEIRKAFDINFFNGPMRLIRGVVQTRNQDSS
jgi:hypothetical protein